MITLTEAEKTLIRKYIGLRSHRHKELYVRTDPDNKNHFQAEIWWVCFHCAGIPEADAVKDLQENWEDFTQESAKAAWLFCNAFPDIAVTLAELHTSTGWEHSSLENLGLED